MCLLIGPLSQTTATSTPAFSTDATTRTTASGLGLFDMDHTWGRAGLLDLSGRTADAWDTRTLASLMYGHLRTPTATGLSLRHGGVLQRGVASWYGPGFHGRLTANGEIYNQNELTAAHKTLPFGTRVVVHNPRTGKEVVVRINDRGPYVSGRIIDLSKAAAKELGMLHHGTDVVVLTKAPEDGGGAIVASAAPEDDTSGI